MVKLLLLNCFCLDYVFINWILVVTQHIGSASLKDHLAVSYHCLLLALIMECNTS